MSCKFFILNIKKSIDNMEKTKVLYLFSSLLAIEVKVEDTLNDRSHRWHLLSKILFLARKISPRSVPDKFCISM